MMIDSEITKEVYKLKALESAKEELEAQIEEIKNGLKEELSLREVDTLITDEFKIVFKEIKSRRVDVKKFREELPEVAKRFLVDSVHKYLRITEVHS